MKSTVRRFLFHMTTWVVLTVFTLLRSSTWLLMENLFFFSNNIDVFLEYRRKKEAIERITSKHDIAKLTIVEHDKERRRKCAHSNNILNSAKMSCQDLIHHARNFAFCARRIICHGCWEKWLVYRRPTGMGGRGGGGGGGRSQEGAFLRVCSRGTLFS